jgi:hypothetical protein
MNIQAAPDGRTQSNSDSATRNTSGVDKVRESLLFEGFAELCGHMGDAEFADRTALDCSCYKIGFLGEELLC